MTDRYGLNPVHEPGTGKETSFINEVAARRLNPVHEPGTGKGKGRDGAPDVPAS